ncbi:LLM class flavin-dependent oxidoreductase [Pseudonocardia humida]|uniref:LLM class flavin-dependent oxidoreductase n=1 Tax=Pseudonocardia humida TaxID=2800819 RepID=A0ABT0ZTS9_9PSEU|nr:LLM class flavin-dependent oxidoreductase [Pseudonocardia humida]MCO1654095.1 LLM class flavin-dependent oxidoreductase [Pseudonocardia humida]
MRFGAHLPLVDFGDGGASAGQLREYARAARDAGFDTLAANDHLLWRRPWLDGPTALAAAAADAGSMTLATTVALPALRHPVVLAKALTTLAALHPGPVVAGIGPGSGRDDFAAVGIPFAQRWSRFDAAARQLRELLDGDGPGPALRPRPDPPPRIWYAGWGSARRLRATAAAADGWIASGHHGGPRVYAATRARLDAHLRAVGRDPRTFPDMVATVWFHVADDPADAAHVLHDLLAPTLSRDPRDLARSLPVGSPEHCVRVLSDYARAGARHVLLWPVGDGVRQLQRCAEEVAPHVPA